MKQIEAKAIVNTVAALCAEANFCLGADVVEALQKARDAERSPLGRQVLEQLLENAEIARSERVPLCQDCGMTVVFLEIGQDVHVAGGDLYGAVEEGVRKGYAEGYLRKSMVSQPFSLRKNTGDNTPPIIHSRIVPGEDLRLVVMPKGGGSENMSRLAMLKPFQGQEGIADFVVRAVEEAGSNPCPPIIVGVGIGGTADKATLLAKKALLRRVGEPNSNEEVAALERALLSRVNALGIGPEGFGGSVTALAVHVEVFPAHIASLPVAVSIQCHSARHKEAVL